MIIRYLIEKEFKQMMRNIILPVVFVMLPVVMMNMVPRVATQEIKNLTFCVIDNDHSTLSSRLTRKIASTDMFHQCAVTQSADEAIGVMKSGEADFIIEIEPDFEKRLVKSGTAAVMIKANATNGIKAGLGQSYLTHIISDFASEINIEDQAAEHTQAAMPTATSRFLYNTRLDYKLFMVPAIISLLLILLVGFLPALNIVGEKEKGTIEQINVTPVSRFHFILSKMIPYWCVGIVILLFSMLLGRAFHGIVPAGSIGLTLLFSTLYILVVSCLGLIVSNHSSTTQQASLVMFFFLVMFILLSGLLTPITGMPQWAKAITILNPMRYYIEAMRMIYIKGSSIADLLPQLTALCVMTIATGAWAIGSYRKNA